MNATDGPFFMPPEWLTQAATWFSWPHNVETWPQNLAEAQTEFSELVRHVSQFQPVRVLVSDNARASAQEQIGFHPNVELVAVPTNDAWARDYAPTFVRGGRGDLIAIDWHYNAWGGKYPPFDQDQKVAERISEYLGIGRIAPGLCLEGGAIEVNGAGIVLSTLSCVLDPNRNASKSLQEIESILCHHLGVRECIWLSGDAIEGDDTDGHIDQLARFTDQETIVYAWSDDPADPQVAQLEQNLSDLKRGLQAAGQGHYRLIPLTIPGPVECTGVRIPASYCNFLIANGLVVVPQFGEPEDARALQTLKPLFPDREVIGLPSRNLSVGLGSFHCLSQQQPLATWE